MPFHDFITDPSGFRLGGAWWWNHLGTTTSCHGQYRTLAWKEHHGSLESDLLVVGWGWRLFLILLTIPTKMDPFKMMSFTLFFLNLKSKTHFCSCKIGWVFGGSSPKNPVFFPNQPLNWWSLWANQPLEILILLSKWTNLWNILGDNRNCSSEKGWFAIVV